MDGPWPRIRLVQGDITRLAVDAIVNAANTSLLGGGGVDGAIHRAAGPELREACRALGGCPPGEARITPGFRLAARWVIHTVGPFYRDGRHGEPEVLASCYRRALELAGQHGVESIAFPAISTGAYRYPFESAMRIALATVSEFLGASALPRQAIFALFTPREYESAARVLAELRRGGGHSSPSVDPPGSDR